MKEEHISLEGDPTVGASPRPFEQIPSVDKTSERQMKEIRKAAGLTQEYVAKALGLKDKNEVYRWEAGKRRPSTDNVLGLSYLYNCSTDELLASRRVAIIAKVKQHQAELANEAPKERRDIYYRSSKWNLEEQRKLEK